MPSTQPLCPGSLRYQEREWLLAQTPEWWADVFDRIACGVSPRDIAKEYALRYAILARVIGETEARQAEYVAALEIASDGYAHEVVAIADDGSNDTYVDDEGRRKVDTDVIARSKLRIDTRLKLAGKWFRGRYGETVKHEVAGTLKVDAGLVMAMGELLQRASTGRVIEHEPLQTLTHSPQRAEESLAVRSHEAGPVPPAAGNVDDDAVCI